MSSTAHKKLRNSSIQLFIYVSILFALLLTSVNLENYLIPKKVLGASTQISNHVNDSQLFWENFLSKNPNYIPGWIEIGREDKASEIDPNYASDKSE